MEQFTAQERPSGKSREELTQRRNELADLLASPGDADERQKKLWGIELNIVNEELEASEEKSEQSEEEDPFSKAVGRAEGENLLRRIEKDRERRNEGETLQ